MQQVEKILGFQIKVSKTLPPIPLEALSRDVLEIAIKNNLNPNDYYVYRHHLGIKQSTPKFLKGTKLADRVHSLVVGFSVNPKQVRDREIVLANKLFRGKLKPIDQYSSSSLVQYTLLGSELADLEAFSNELITFVHRNLPLRHRKLKIAVLARPTDIIPAKLRQRICTKLDLWYDVTIQRGTRDPGAG
jgi:hypothetical protein